MERANGRCEIHYLGSFGVSDSLTWHHALGRSHIISEPWASWYPLTVMLCNGHHIDVHVDTELRRKIEYLALERFATATEWYGHRFWEIGSWTPIQAIKEMIRNLEEHEPGKYPTGFSIDGRV